MYAERPALGHYISVDVDRGAAARFGLNIADIEDVISLAVGGAKVGEAINGRERYPISVRYPQSWRDSVARLETLPVVTPTGAQITLGDIAHVEVAAGPAAIRSENARPAAWVTIDPGARDLGTFVSEAQIRVAAAGIVPRGYHLTGLVSMSICSARWSASRSSSRWSLASSYCFFSRPFAPGAM